MKKIKRFGLILLLHMEDFLILSGLVVVNVTTYLLNTIAGLYATGIILLLLGIYFLLNPIKRGR